MADLARILNLRIPDCDHGMVHYGTAPYVPVQSLRRGPTSVPAAVWCLLPGLVHIPSRISDPKYAILCPMEEKNHAL